MSKLLETVQIGQVRFTVESHMDGRFFTFCKDDKCEVLSTKRSDVDTQFKAEVRRAWEHVNAVQRFYGIPDDVQPLSNYSDLPVL